MPRRVVELMDNEVCGTITLSEAGKYLGISIRTIYQMANDGQIPGCFKIGWSWRVDKEIFFAHTKRGVHSASQSQVVDNCESAADIETGGN